MIENDKIHVSNYLKDLNERVDHAIRFQNLDKDTVKKITCKDLAQLCEVTPATITNLTTSSKYCLLHKIAGQILDSYYGYFMLNESFCRKEYPDELIYPRDINYIIMNLVSYYTDSWDNY